MSSKIVLAQVSQPATVRYINIVLVPLHFYQFSRRSEREKKEGKSRKESNCKRSIV